MKKILRLLLTVAFLATIFTGCETEDNEIIERLSTTAVSNMRATAYEGANVVTWNYKADANNGYIISRTVDGIEKQLDKGTLKMGENVYVDRFGDSNQLVNEKTYKYTVYTIPSTSSAFVEKAASSSASTKAIIKTPSEMVKGWDSSEITAKVETYNGKTYVVVTRPHSYAYTYSPTLTINYQITTYNPSTKETKTSYESKTLKSADIKAVDSTRKEGKDGTAKDYYLIEKGSAWTNVRYTISATKSLGGTASQLGFYKTSNELTYASGGLDGNYYPSDDNPSSANKPSGGDSANSIAQGIYVTTAGNSVSIGAGDWVMIDTSGRQYKGTFTVSGSTLYLTQTHYKSSGSSTWSSVPDSFSGTINSDGSLYVRFETWRKQTSSSVDIDEAPPTSVGEPDDQFVWEDGERFYTITSINDLAGTWKGYNKTVKDKELDLATINSTFKEYGFPNLVSYDSDVDVTLTWSRSGSLYSIGVVSVVEETDVFASDATNVWNSMMTEFKEENSDPNISIENLPTLSADKRTITFHNFTRSVSVSDNMSEAELLSDLNSGGLFRVNEAKTRLLVTIQDSFGLDEKVILSRK